MVEKVRPLRKVLERLKSAKPPKNADSARIMDPDPDYPNGYVVFTDSKSQPLNLAGKPGTRAETHIAINPDRSYSIPKGWHP